MNKKLLCVAVGSSLVAAAGTAQAAYDAYWFQLIPYVVKDANRTTVVSLVGLWPQIDPNGSVHLQYWTKSTTDANTAACQPSSVTVPVTSYDIMTFDTAGILGYPLFGDTTNPAPLGVGISFPGPRHGYLVVDGLQNGASSAAISQTYWLELDLANGGAHGDIGLPSDFGPDANYSGFLNGSPFPSRFDSLAPVLPNNSAFYFATPVNFWPSSVASTAFTVTPGGTAMLTRENNQVVMQVFNTDPVQGAYDRNENGVDGTVPITVRCVGRVTPAQLMPGVVANAAWAAQGGWGWLANLGNNDTVYQATNGGDLAAIVYQVDNASAGGKFMSNATRIVSGYLGG